jgi:hypothetical protein
MELENRGVGRNCPKDNIAQTNREFLGEKVMRKFTLIVLMISAMVSQCQAGVAGLPSESPGLMNWNYGTSPADESAISVPAIALPADINSIEYATTPVPEPATLMLLGMGFLMAVPLKRR